MLRSVAMLAVCALLWTTSGRVVQAHEGAHDEHSAHARHQGWYAQMVANANGFLDTLGPELRGKATFPFDSDERQNWHFIPRERNGASFRDMNLKQRRAGHTLLRSALSAKGYLKATTIMTLEQILRELEKDRPNVESFRDQENYLLSIFGTPSAKEPWGWRIEGHHLSLNFTAAGGKLVSSTPLFLGANPAEVPTGPRAGLRTLAAEEDLARKLLGMLSDEQRKQAVLANEAPADIFLKPGGEPIDLKKPAGISAAHMSPAQRRVLWRLVEEYATNLRAEVANKELAAIRDSGLNHIHFAWAGPSQRGQGHYYRIQGPDFVIEYDNTQNNANHIHAVWHSLEGDFGLDVLRKHYEESPHHR